jgi:rod shape-determining protein MreD
MNLRRRDVLYYLMPLLLFIAALLQSTLLVRMEVGSVKPDLVLILVIVGTLIYGAKNGVVWAFVGGLALDLLSGGPFGSSSLALIAAAVVASPGHRTLSRFNAFVPLAAAALGTLAYGVTYIAALAFVEVTVALPFFSGLNLTPVDYRLDFLPTLQYVVLPAMAYNTLVVLVMTPALNLVPESHDVGV